MIRFIGDSITVGVGASTAARSWVSLVASAKGWASYLNLGDSGSMAWDHGQSVYAQNIASSDISFVALGTNDEKVYKESTSGLDAFKHAMMAIVAWLGTTNKVKANSASVTYTGNWNASQFYPFGKQTSQPGAKATFTINGSTIYVATTQTSNIPGIAKIYVDGLLARTVNTNITEIPTGFGTVYGPNLERIVGLSSGLHTVEVVCESGSIFFDWSGRPDIQKVYVVSPSRKSPQGYANTGGGEWGMKQHWQAERDLVDAFQADGMEIYFIDTMSVINAPADTIDGVHPSDYGHSVIASTVLSKVKQ